MARVGDGIDRGAQPEQGGLQALADLGIRTIVNLRSDDHVRRERAGAETLGLRFVNIPMAGAGRPADDAMRDALAEAKELGMGFWQYGLRQYIWDGCGAVAGVPPGAP